MIARTIQIIRKSRDLIQQTNELLRQGRDASSQITLLRPAPRIDPELPQID